MRKQILPMVSVLIVTKGHPDELLENLDLLMRNCSYRREIEILARFDEDKEDLAGDGGAAAELDLSGDKVFVGSPLGWRNIHLGYNELASHARGKWLFPLSDDAKVETKGWDRRLHRITEKMAMVKFEDGWRPGPNFPCFPLIPRTVYEVLGHLSLSPHVGLWLDEVMRQRAGFPLKYFPEVTINHVKPRPGADETIINESYADFYSLDGENARNEDARKLLDFMGRQPAPKPRTEMLERKLDAISRRWFLSSLRH